MKVKKWPVSSGPASLEDRSNSLTEPPASAITKESVRDLIHDLRQPLGTIEAIAYLMEMTLPVQLVKPRQYMRELQQLVRKTNATLVKAASKVNRPN